MLSDASALLRFHSHSFFSVNDFFPLSFDLSKNQFKIRLDKKKKKHMHSLLYTERIHFLKQFKVCFYP